MDKKEILVLEDSAVAAWNVGSPSITINLLKDGAIDLLKNLANLKIISFAKPTVEKKIVNTDDINNIFDKHLYPFNDFKFNRNEANNYE